MMMQYTIIQDKPAVVNCKVANWQFFFALFSNYPIIVKTKTNYTAPDVLQNAWGRCYFLRSGAEHSHMANCREFPHPVAEDQVERRAAGTGTDVLKSGPFGKGLGTVLVKFLRGNDHRRRKPLFLHNLFGELNVFKCTG